MFTLLIQVLMYTMGTCYNLGGGTIRRRNLIRNMHKKSLRMVKTNCNNCLAWYTRIGNDMISYYDLCLQSVFISRSIRSHLLIRFAYNLQVQTLGDNTRFLHVWCHIFSQNFGHSSQHMVSSSYLLQNYEYQHVYSMTNSIMTNSIQLVCAIVNMVSTGL